MIKSEAPAAAAPAHPLHQYQQRFRSSTTSTTRQFAALTKPTACLMLLLLSYALGYLSALRPASSSSNTSITPPIPTTNFQHPGPAHAPPPSPLDHDQHHHYDGYHHKLFGTVCAAAAHRPPVPPQLVRQTIIDRVFNGTSPWDNFPPPHVARLLRPTKLIKGWGSTSPVFAHLIRTVRPKTIIELGTFLGASAIHMAELILQIGSGGGGGGDQPVGNNTTQIICVDDFRGWPGFQQEERQRRWFKDLKMVNGDVTLLHQFMRNVVRANATHVVSFLPFSTASALDKLCEWGILGDLIEVDAGHDFHSAWSDINRAYKILRPGGGGVLFGHDYLTAADNKGVRRAVDLFARLHNLRIQLHGQHWILLHPNKHTTLF